MYFLSAEGVMLCLEGATRLLLAHGTDSIVKQHVSPVEPDAPEGCIVPVSGCTLLPP